MAAKTLDGLTLDQVSNRIRRWYEANPDHRNIPVALGRERTFSHVTYERYKAAGSSQPCPRRRMHTAGRRIHMLVGTHVDQRRMQLRH